MLTEAEAKTKVCHRTMRPPVDDNGIPVSNCIGSDCMAWRWGRKPNPDWKPDNSMMMSSYLRDTRNDPPMYVEDTTRGFCGLAGKES